MPGCQTHDDHAIMTQEALTAPRNTKLPKATAGILYSYNGYNMSHVIFHTLNYVPSYLSVTKLGLLNFAVNRKTQPRWL